jgi:hypothetical protein
MPSALYTIAYKPTSSVVALCSFEKREISDAAAAAQLLGELVGVGLPVPMSRAGAAIEIAASELGCDLVTDPSPQDLQAILANPYRYRVNSAPTEAATTTPGDGKEKVLIAADVIGVSSVELIPGAPSGPTAHVVVTLTGNVTFPATARLLFDDRQPMVLQTSLEEKGLAVSHELVFELVDIEVEPEEEHDVMFLMEGAPVVARTLTARGPESDAAAPAARTVLRKRTPKPETKAPRKLRRTARRKRPRKAIKARR